MRVSEKGQYYGVKKKEKDFSSVFLSQYTYEDKSTDWHYHENPYLMYVISGNMTDRSKNGTTLCPSGSLIFQNWDEQHLNTKESAYGSGFHLEFDRGWLKHYASDLSLSSGQKRIDHPLVHNLLGQIYLEFHRSDSYSPITIETLVIQLCDAITAIHNQSSKLVPSWISRLIEILESGNSDITLQSLSEALGVHPVHISRAIPKYLGMTLGNYLRLQKIRESLPPLIDKKTTLTSIAYNSGFADQSHFTRTFKKVYKVTPKKYRKIVRLNA